jgi:SprT protein
MSKSLTEMQITVKEAVAFYIDLANDLYGVDLDMPKIIFKVRGRTAGKAFFAEWSVNFNNVLLEENFDDMLEQTVPHEVAHLVARQISQYRITPHGAEWKRVMRGFGKDPKRCHTYDVSNAQVRFRKPSKKYLYECGGCGVQITIGATRHKRCVRGASYITKCCRKPIQLAETKKWAVA